MISSWEIAANLLNATSIVLAAKNNLHTWWTGIVGCALFGYLFYTTRLYADVTLQLFFIVTSFLGWWNWRRGMNGTQKPIRRSRTASIARLFALAIFVALLYGTLLYRLTDAYAPFLDSVVLAFSVLGQFLLVARRIETWWCWLLVNTIAVPLYASRGLYLTALLYSGFWVNALVAHAHWRRLLSCR
ncbi:MAG: nicotinamide riboside transporter PnuC [Desulfatitalea sp.]